VAAADIRIDDFEDGVLPPVCVVTGRPADGYRPYRFGRTPGWILFALVLGPVGIVVLLVLALTTRRTVSGYLPVCDDALAHGRRWRRNGWIAVLAGGAVDVFFAFVFDSFGNRALFVVSEAVGAGLVVAGLWIVARPPGSVGGRPDRVERWVHISPVSVAFFDAYERQERRRMDERRHAAGVDELLGG
jgi:hypothetical protein